ncbi:MAG: ADP-ribosylglycohydrolase family protein [Actinobacteria bacterium]|nr:MAG: ADP-ribosylglycohydrolase family protein [Actinomycetota bacterium]
MERFEGCLVGGAVGDALGAPVEFTRLEFAQVSGLQPWGGHPAGSFTDDTQMTIATAEGLLRAHRAGADPADGVWERYLRWYARQSEPGYARAPDSTCLAALEGGGFARAARNDSKGCGGVMRIAPVGLAHYGDPPVAFDLGCRIAGLTHGHPTGRLAAGCLAEIVARVTGGSALDEAIAKTRVRLTVECEGAETLAALDRAVGMAEVGAEPAEVAIAVAADPVKGAGWVAEECLAVAVAAALAHPDDYRAGVLAAVNIDGDRDSTGAVAGGLLGAMLGLGAVPAEWDAAVEDRDRLLALARELHVSFG